MKYRDWANKDKNGGGDNRKEARILWAALTKIETGMTASREGSVPTEGRCS
jgi:hypothetical protein